MRKLVLWGQGIQEYQAMFDLTEDVFHSSILEYGCGPTAINAIVHRQKQQNVVSCDSLFALPLNELKREVTRLFDLRVKELRADQYQLDTSFYGGLESFIEARRAGCVLFFDDFVEGVNEGRYLSAQLPLSFENATFQYALSSHCFFTNFSQEKAQILVAEHVEAIKELSRVAHEVRIFPIINRAGEASSLLGPVLMALQQENYGVEVREVPFSLYPKGNAMLRVWANTCVITPS